MPINDVTANILDISNIFFMPGKDYPLLMAVPNFNIKLFYLSPGHNHFFFIVDYYVNLSLLILLNTCFYISLVCNNILFRY